MRALADWIAVATFALVWSAAPAVAQPVLTQTGRALDANPSVGGGPSNPAVTPSFGLGSHYLITGEARLGRSFQGFVPYSSTNQFQGSLGSASLYNFTRDAASLPMITGSTPGGIYQPQPFLYTPRTVFRAGQVTPNAFASGEQTTTTVLNPFAQPRYLAGPQPAASAQPTAYGPTQRPLDPLPTLSSPGLSLSDQLVYRRRALAEQDRWRRPDVTLGPPQSSTGSIEKDASGQGPPIPMHRDWGPQPGGIGPQLRYNPLDARTETSTPRLGLDSPFKPLPGRAGQLPHTPRAPEAQGPSADQPPRDRQAGPAHRLGAGPGPGQDLYSDLLRRAAEIHEQPGKPAEKPGPERTGTPQAPDESAQPGRVEPPAIGPAITPPASIQTRPLAAGFVPVASNGVWTPGQPSGGTPPDHPIDLAVHYDSFASKRPDQANVAMRKAEQLLKQRRFYKALDQLTEAKRWDPANPLVWLRACHAYVGAGEFYSASVDLRQAIRIFPSVTSVKTDLAGLLGPDGGRFLDHRMAQLQRFVQRTDQTPLWMVLCYLQYTTGRTSQSVRTAEHLLSKAGEDREAAALARFVLSTGKGNRQSAPTTAPEED